MPKAAKLIGDAVPVELWYDRGGYRSMRGLRGKTSLTAAELMTWALEGECIELCWWQHRLFGLRTDLGPLPSDHVVLDLFAGTGGTGSLLDPVHSMDVLQQQLAADPDHAGLLSSSARPPRQNSHSQLIAAAETGDLTVPQAYVAMLESRRALMPYLLQVRRMIVEMAARGHLYLLGVRFDRPRRQDGRYPLERIIPSAFTPTSFVTPTGMLVDQPAVVRASKLRFPVDSVLEIFPLGPICDVEPRFRKPSPYVDHLRATEAEDRERARGGRPRNASEPMMKELFLELRAAGRLVGNANAISRQICDEAEERGMDDVPGDRAVAKWVRGWLDEIRRQEDQHPAG